MIKKLIAGVLACVCCVGAFGCGSKDKKEESSISEAVENEQENVMLSFENYDELVSVLMLGAPFGGTDFCSDKDYVVEGEHSLRVAPEGEYGTVNTYPTMTIYTDGESFNAGDFSDLDNISLYVYNANDVELHVQMAINANDNQNATVYAPARIYTLTPNSWNKIEYDFTGGALRKSMNNLLLVNHITLSFMEYKQTKEDKPYIYYLDCLQGQKSRSAIAEYSANVQDGEIYNFEKMEDKYSVLESCTNKEAYFLPITSICTDKAFATVGKQSLKVEYPCVKNDRVRSHGNIYSYLYFDMSKVTVPEGAEAVSMDVVNGNDFPVILSITACDELGNLTSTSEELLAANTTKTFVVNSVELSYLRLNFTNRIEPVYSVLYVDNVRFH